MRNGQNLHPAIEGKKAIEKPFRPIDGDFQKIQASVGAKRAAIDKPGSNRTEPTAISSTASLFCKEFQPTFPEVWPDSA
jgi:hypothetical protein